MVAWVGGEGKRGVLAWVRDRGELCPRPSYTRGDNGQTVAAAATSQVKLCPYDEEEPAIWFCLIKAQFTAAGIKSQKLRYAKDLASLPKQALQDILDTVDVCNELDQPFDLLKEVLLRQFGKNKWQSNFE
jgi:hypothetical protein